MSNAPAHSAEHDQLMQLVAKITDKSKLIEGTILITIGVDGRPCIGGNFVSPAIAMEILRQLAAAENQIANVSRVDLPKDN